LFVDLGLACNESSSKIQVIYGSLWYWTGALWDKSLVFVCSTWRNFLVFFKVTWRDWQRKVLNFNLWVASRNKFRIFILLLAWFSIGIFQETIYVAPTLTLICLAFSFFNRESEITARWRRRKEFLLQFREYFMTKKMSRWQ
jgi:hypothetical protein